jgi:hypothetical protein
MVFNNQKQLKLRVEDIEIIHNPFTFYLPTKWRYRDWFCLESSIRQEKERSDLCHVKKYCSMLIVSALNERGFDESLRKCFETLIVLGFTHFDTAFFNA